MAVVTEVLARISANPSNFVSGMQQAAAAAEQFSQSVAQTTEQSSTSLMGLVSRVQGLRAAIAGSAVGVFAMTGVNAAAAYEQQVISFEGIFKGLGKSAQDAQDYLVSLRDFAATTPFELPGLLDATKRLLTLGYTAEDVRDRVMPTVGDIVAALGQPPASINAVVYAFGQMKSAGRVLSQDLMQIGNALPGFNAKMAIANTLFEGNMQAMNEALEKGTLSSEQAIEAMLTAMQKFPGAGGAMERQSKSLNGVLSTFRDNINNARIDGFAASLPAVSTALTAIEPPLSAFVGGLSRLIGSVLPGLISVFGAVAIPVLQVGKAVLDAMSPVVGFLATQFERLGAFLQQNREVIQGVVVTLLAMAAAYKVTTLAITAYNYAMSMYAKVKTAATAANGLFSKSLKGVGAAIKANPIGFLVTALVGLVTAFMYAWRSSEAFREGVIKGFNFIAKYVGIAIGWVMRTLGNLMLAFSRVMNVNTLLGKVVATVFNFIWRLITTVVSGILSAYISLVDGVVNLIENNEWLYKAIVAVFNGIAKVIGTVIGGILRGLGSFLSGLRSLTTTALDSLASLAEGAGNVLSKIPAVSGIGNALNSAASGIRNLSGAINSSLSSAQNTLNSWATSVENLGNRNVGEALLGGFLSGAKRASAALKQVRSAVQRAGTFELGNAIVNAASNAAQTAGNWLIGAAEKVENFTSENAFEKISDAVGNLFDKIKDGLGIKESQDIWDNFKDMKENLDEVTKAAGKTDDKSAKDIKDRVDVMEKIREALARGMDTLTGVVNDLKKSAQDYAKTLKDSIMSFAGVAAIDLPDGFIPQAKSLIGNMRERLARAQEFTKDIAKLQALGLNANTLKSILDAGPIKGAQLAQSILGGGAAAVAEINDLQKSLEATGIGLGAVGSEAVFGADIADAERALKKLDAAARINQIGNQVNIQQGAFQVSIDISGAKDDDDIIRKVENKLDQKFKELAAAIAAAK